MKAILRPFVLAGSLFAASFAHGHTLSLVPSSTSIIQGATVSVNLIASDLDASAPGNIVSGFDVDISFDDSLLALLGATFSSSLGSDSDVLSGFTSGNPANLFSVSFLLDSDLEVLQPGPSITLATMSFRGVANGNGAVSLAVNSLSSGLDLGQSPSVARLEQDVQTNSAIIEIKPRGQVAEPGSLALFALLMAWFASISLVILRNRLLAR